MNLVNKFKIMTYNIGFIKKDISKIFDENIKENDIIWMKHNYKDRYFADPFLIKEDDSFYYVLCEEFVFWEEKGKIVLLLINKKDFSLSKRKLIIEESYHLSFPYCKINNYWIIPEASASGRTYAYRIDLENFNVKEKIEILSEGLIDNVFFRDEKKELWIYAGKTIIPSAELYEYRSNESNSFKLTKSSPIQNDNRHSRSAGDFFEFNNKLYRPVQDCMGRYGRQTKIMEVLSIGEKGYDAVETCTLNSFINPPYDETMHTFNVYKNIIIVDGSKDFLRFPMKIFYKKFSWLFKHRLREDKEV